MLASGRLFGVIIFLMFILVGCSKPMDGDSSDASADAPDTEASDSAGAEEDSVLVEMGLDESADESDEMNPLDQGAVYFDYDEATVSEQAQEIIRAHAEVLVQNPGVTLHLAGHADERGTREYNLALGNERATSVSSFFQQFGVDSSRITAVSFGEEVPAVMGADEESWALNRRVEITHDLMQ